MAKKSKSTKRKTSAKSQPKPKSKPKSKPTAPKATNPHDGYVQVVFLSIPEARGFFLAYLPANVIALFDWDTLRAANVVFISDQLGRQFADLRFTVCLKGQRKRRRISLLFEHKRSVRYTTPRQLFGYMSHEIGQAEESEPLPAILTVVLVQHGIWKRPPRLSSEYDLPDEALQVLGPYLLDFGFITVELTDLGEDELQGTPEGRFALTLLKCVGQGEPFSWTKFESVLQDLAKSPNLDKIFARAESYLLSTTDESQETQVREAVAEIPEQFPKIKKAAMTLGEAIEKRGEARGERRGEAKIVRRQLEKAYPKLTAKDFAQLEKLDEAALVSLADAIVLQRPLAEVKRLLKGG